MAETANKRGKVTEEHREEARRLRAIWDRTRLEREAAGIGSQEAFGARFEIGNQAAVGFFLNAKTALSLKAAAGFARGLGCQVSDFSPRLARQLFGAGHMPGNWKEQQHASERPAPGWVDHGMSHEARESTPRHIDWELIAMQSPLEAEFQTVMPDASMAPDVPRGARVIFVTGVDPRGGDFVLVADQLGNLYLREYRQLRPGHWQAHARNPAFLPLDSERDGLRVVAVFDGMRGRRSAH